MPTPTALTIHLFGATSLLIGLLSFLQPTLTLSYLNLPETALPTLKSSNCAAIAMGLFYILAAYQENRAFFKLSVATRLFTTIVFIRMGGMWTGLAAWEGGGAVVTAVVLVWEGRGKRKGV